MSLFLLLLATALYFIRPAEFMPSLFPTRLYLWVVLPCMAISMEKWSGQLSPRSLAAYPVSALVLGLLAMTGLSELISCGSLSTTTEFGKAIVHYFLLVAIVDTDTRHTIFLWGLVFILGTLASLMLLGTDTEIEFSMAPEHHSWRAEALGASFDANDTAMILVVGILIAMHFLVVRQSLLLRTLASGSAAVMLAAFQTTNSRGGFLSLIFGIAVYLILRWGKKGVMFGVCLLPLGAAWVATERMSGIGTAFDGQDTGQLRIQMWVDAMALFRQNPLFGLGPNGFLRHVGRAPHNTFLQPYAELGFLGGTLFLGAFLCGFMTLFHIIRKPSAHDVDQAEDHALCPAEDDASNNAQPAEERHPLLLHRRTPEVCLMAAILAAYGMGILALNQLYLTNTYVILGLATVTARLHNAQNMTPSSTLLVRLGAASVAFLLISRAIALFMVSW